jgi:hypothetical protein
MKRVVAAVACGAMLTAIYPADTTAQGKQAAPAAVAAPAAAAAPAPEKSKPAAHAKRRPWTRADARVCLEFPTNAQIIRCAEKYRYMRVPT